MAEAVAQSALASRRGAFRGPSITQSHSVLTRVRPADQKAAFAIDLDCLGAAERFGGPDNLVTHPLKLRGRAGSDCWFELQASAKGEASRCFNRGLRVKPAGQQASEEMRMASRLIMAAHDSE